MRSPSEAADEVVEGVVERITFENDLTGFRVVKVGAGGRELVTVVGTMQPVHVGARIRAAGRFQVDPQHGRQLRARTVLQLEPETRAGIERFLGSGLAAGIGPGFAKRIVKQFGDRTAEVLDRHAERLVEVHGLGRQRAKALAKAWADQKAAREVMIFLEGHGISPALAARVLRRYGSDAIRLVAQNPYRLASDVWGIGFQKADEMARSMGIAADAPERVQAAVLHVLDQATERGHVFVPRVGLAIDVHKAIEVPAELVERAIDDVREAKQVRQQLLGDFGASVYPTRLYAAEVGVGSALRRLCDAEVTEIGGVERAIQAFERRTGTTLAAAQREAVMLSARSSVLVITGGPGVGKTTIVRALLELHKKAGLRVRLAAPTGRAARRMEEATGHEAQTVHRLLEFEPKGAGFARDDRNPLDLDVLIVDEASMLDLSLAHALLQALPNRARLVLVGDVDQLPSIGAGTVLRDTIESGRVACIKLTQIFRQASGSQIVENAHRILRAEMPLSAPSGDRHGEFFILEVGDPDQAAQRVRQLVVERIPARFGMDPARDVQVLTPMHKGAAGSDALNRMLQECLNPAHGKPGGFRVNDKVMQLRNDYGRDVFNGDVGFVRSIDHDAGEVVVDIEGRSVTYDGSQLDELRLAYACSVHKSQGSEYPAVVVVMLRSHFIMLSRNLLYTAVTRGKRLVVLVTDRTALRVALDETRREERYSYLAQRLRGMSGQAPSGTCAVHES